MVAARSFLLALTRAGGGARGAAEDRRQLRCTRPGGRPARQPGAPPGRPELLRAAAAAIVLITALTACSRDEPAPVSSGRRPAGGATAARAHEPAGPTRVEIENVVLQAMPGVELRVHRLRGTLEPTREGEIPSFDDSGSFRIAVESGEVALDAASLATVLDDYVFADPSSPLSDLEIHTEGDRLVQKGKLHKKVSVPFEVEGRVEIAPGDRLRLHPSAIRAAGLPVAKVLDVFDVEMSEVLHLDGRRGLTAEGDDLFLDPARMLPPPAIDGHPSHVEVGGNEVRLTFGEPGRAAGRSEGEPGYMQFRGGSLRFGKLTMRDTDLRLTDADPRDPFHFSLRRYNEQLVAGYSKNTPDGGLRVTMPDLEDASRPGGDPADLRPE